MNETRYVILQLPPIPSLLAILYASRGATCGPLPEFSLLNIVEEPQCPKKKKKTPGNLTTPTGARGYK